MLPPLQRFDFGGGRLSSSKIAFMGCLREQKYARHLRALSSAKISPEGLTSVERHHNPQAQVKVIKVNRCPEGLRSAPRSIWVAPRCAEARLRELRRPYMLRGAF